MNPKPPASAERKRELFLAALEREPSQRASFLKSECGTDHALLERIQALLREHEGVGSFLETPALGSPAPKKNEGTEVINQSVFRVQEKAGDRIGPYKILQQIGEGGCGVVYMAEQEKPVRRRVALKIIKLGMDTKSVIARFEAERQALAMMDHSHIARVLDAGATETGRPYFVMELVRGIKITEYCDQNHLPSEERLGLFITVCNAIQHAHQKGIIHRDIKPSNILVTLHDGQPIPKVIDFGIAKATEQKLTDKTLFTEFQAFIGTPAYMSPEQAEMSGLDIDTRSDIYSLGVLLYQLLTGKTPFDAETLFQSGLEECRRTIREIEPPRPSTRLETMVDAELTTTARQRKTEAGKLIQLLHGDLDWIVMKCLEKDRTRRYATANELAMDVRRYLESQPVEARPPTTIYRMQKLVRRHRVAVTVGLGIAAMLILGIALSTWLTVRALRAEKTATKSQQQEVLLRKQAEQERRSGQINEYEADMNLAHQSVLAGNFGRAVQLVEKHRPKPGETDLRGFEWRYLWQLCQGNEHVALPSQEEPVQSALYSPTGDLVAIAAREKLTLWRTSDHHLVKTLPQAASMAFLPNGKSFITASRSDLRVWNTADWSEKKRLPGGSDIIAVSPRGTLFATSNREGIRIWDSTDWKEVQSLQGRTFPGAMGRLAFSPDGRFLAADSREGTWLWSLDSGRKEVLLQNSSNAVPFMGPPSRGGRNLVFSPDGKYIIAPNSTVSERGDFTLKIWEAGSGREVGSLPEPTEPIAHTSTISSLAFSPDGQRLVTGSWDHSIRLWDFGSRRQITVFQGHVSEVWSVAFSPDGQKIVSGAKDGGVKIWPVLQPSRDEMIPGSWHPLGFSKDGKLLAAMNREEGMVNFFNLTTQEVEKQIQLEAARSRSGPMPPQMGPSAAISADLRTLVQTVPGGIQIWNTASDEKSLLKTGEEHVDQVALSPDGKTLITGKRERSLRLWDLRSNTNVVLDSEAMRVMFSPDGRTLAAFPRGNPVQLWDVASRTLKTNLVIDPPAGFGGTFSPDNKMLAVGTMDNNVRLLDIATGALLGEFAGHKQPVFGLAFSPDGKTLATSSDDSTIKLWSLQTFQELLTIRRVGGHLSGLSFSPDGRFLIGASPPFSKSPKMVVYSAPSFKETDRVRK